jgi:hypothetical protein
MEEVTLSAPDAALETTDVITEVTMDPGATAVALATAEVKMGRAAGAPEPVAVAATPAQRA